MKLMIVNDEIITTRAIKKEIAWEQYGIDEVLLAFDAEEAKGLLMQETVDIMLCDIEMPGDNGIELLRWVREQKMDVDCIFLTCYASFSYAQDAIKLSCMDYILMPADYEEIGAAVLKVVNRRRNVAESERMQKYGEQWVSEKKEQAVETQGGTKSKSRLIKECEEYILEHLGEESFAVGDVAEYCNLNAIYLNRIFKQEREISITQYIIKERMELAGRLLKDGELNANIVAEEVGYPNYPYFSAAFKKYYGVSPKQYIDREKNRKG